MNWGVEYTKTFLKELARLPKEVQTRAEEVVFQRLTEGAPSQLGIVEKMSGYPDKYKIRVGSYRIGLTIDKKAKKILCERIVHRRDIYRVFP